MALINCPSCRKRISNVLNICPHCGFALGEVTEDQIREFERRKQRDRVYHLKMTSYAVMTLFVAAFGWYWWESAGFQSRPSAGPLSLVAIGALAYLLVRVFLFRAKRRLRALRD